MSKKDTGPSIAAPFSDPKNITVGCGRVIWVDGCLKHSEGWILPGGAITQDPDIARSAAYHIDALSKQ
jgi:hypothetical protein